MYDDPKHAKIEYICSQYAIKKAQARYGAHTKKTVVTIMKYIVCILYSVSTMEYFANIHYITCKMLRRQTVIGTQQMKESALCIPFISLSRHLTTYFLHSFVNKVIHCISKQFCMFKIK
jgi:hypothetical protein